jgi:hypothetical protein
MRKFSTICLLFGVLVVFAILLYPVMSWTGSTTVCFRFHVIESDSNRRVTDAKIRVVNTSDSPDVFSRNFGAAFPAVMADTNGIISVLVTCGAVRADFLVSEGGSRFRTSYLSKRMVIDRLPQLLQTS